MGVSDVTISPPLNITVQTFATVANFCYTHKVHLTPSNVAPIRVAAELLGMTEGENLCEVTESYFDRVVAVDASMVMRSCVTMLPEAETTASLVSRCIEALIWNGDVSFVDDVVEMRPQDFQMVASYLNKRLPDHDALYKIIDLYLKVRHVSSSHIIDRVLSIFQRIITFFLVEYTFDSVHVLIYNLLLKLIFDESRLMIN